MSWVQKSCLAHTVGNSLVLRRQINIHRLLLHMYSLSCWCHVLFSPASVVLSQPLHCDISYSSVTFETQYKQFWTHFECTYCSWCINVSILWCLELGMNHSISASHHVLPMFLQSIHAQPYSFSSCHMSNLSVCMGKRDHKQTLWYLRWACWYTAFSALT